MPTWSLPQIHRDCVLAATEEMDPSEEPEAAVPPDALAEVFSEADQLAAKQEEFDDRKSFEAFHEVSRAEVDSVILTPTWVQTVKNGKLRYRLCCRPFGQRSTGAKTSCIDLHPRR
jgi:hypothetical protein